LGTLKKGMSVLLIS